MLWDHYTLTREQTVVCAVLLTQESFLQIDQPELLIPIAWDNKSQTSRAKPQVGELLRFTLQMCIRRSNFSKIKVCFCLQALRPFLASCQRYLALLGSPQSESMKHVGLFISLSSELAVAASPLHYRQSTGQLHQRMTIKELQVPMKSIGSLKHVINHILPQFYPVPKVIV